MKLILQLAIVALLLNAAFQTAKSYYSFNDFKAKLREDVHHGRMVSTTDLHKRTIALGESYGLSIHWENVKVRLEAGQTIVDVSYVDQVPFIPKYYYRYWPYTMTVSAIRDRPLVETER